MVSESRAALTVNEFLDLFGCSDSSQGGLLEHVLNNIRSNSSKCFIFPTKNFSKYLVFTILGKDSSEVKNGYDNYFLDEGIIKHQRIDFEYGNIGYLLFRSLLAKEGDVFLYDYEYIINPEVFNKEFVIDMSSETDYSFILLADNY